MTEPAGEGLRAAPVEWTARLGRALRDEGVSCTLTESLAAVEALEQLDLSDALDAYFGLRAVFTSDPSETPAFDRCFWTLWGQPQRSEAGGSMTVSEGGVRRTAGERDASADLAERLRSRVGGREPPDPGEAPDRSGAEGLRVGAAYSSAEVLARRSFGTLAEAEVRELDHVFDRLMLRLSTRRSRRLRPARGRRGRIDVRRSLRDSLRHEGELLRLARRRRKIERPRLVLLCDVSGSMEKYSRFLVRFLLAAGRERDVETFVFSTRLTRLTPWLVGTRVDEALDALGERVPGWSGGTRIGASLEEFLERHGRAMLGQRTVVIVLSDGLDQGETEPLERAMRGIQRRARKLIWLNPLLESSEYRPEARGMKAALPFVDAFASGHSLQALRELASLIRL